MGIKNYLKFLKLLIIKKTKYYDYVYLDCNYLLHYLIYKCNDDIDLQNYTNNLLNSILHKIIILKKLYLIFDGNFDTALILNPKKQTHILRYKNNLPSDEYSKQEIFPKSPIIKKFISIITEIIIKLKANLNMKFDLEINNDYINGEADFKILDMIYESKENNILIISKDTDMILIGYSLMIKKNIKIDILSNLNPLLLINLKKLYYINEIKVNEINNYNQNKILNNTYDYDYVLLVLFLGNDYLPKLSNVTYENLILFYNIYKSYNNNNIIFENNINYNNLINFLTIVIINKKIKFSTKKLSYENFLIYVNNLEWCLKIYKVFDNNLVFKPTLNPSDQLKTINIYNFINYYINN